MCLTNHNPGWHWRRSWIVRWIVLLINTHWAVPDISHMLNLFNIGLSISWNLSVHFSSIVNIIVIIKSVYHTYVKIKTSPSEKIRQNVISDSHMNILADHEISIINLWPFFKELKIPYCWYHIRHTWSQTETSHDFCAPCLSVFCVFITLSIIETTGPLVPKTYMLDTVALAGSLVVKSVWPGICELDLMNYREYEIAPLMYCLVVLGCIGQCLLLWKCGLVEINLGFFNSTVEIILTRGWYMSHVCVGDLSNNCCRITEQMITHCWFDWTRNELPWNMNKNEVTFNRDNRYTFHCFRSDILSRMSIS